ncbi:uncharacterized protein M6B38_139160 [Iris pallida]|uniref:THO complex subunit 2 n=1 Tax=Iris pallida TaxID=29817 RepID=A0AAX6FDH1_IRIPA|nr:uncharacterized protein M6B38_139160 [Iris pallida]
MGSGPDRSSKSSHGSTEGKCMAEETSGNNIQLANSFFVDYLNLQADYLQLLDHQDCEIRASEFQRLALDLCSQHDITSEGHDAAIDALLLAAECYVNPFFMVSFRPTSKLIDQINTIKSKMKQNDNLLELGRGFRKKNTDLEKIANLEAKRDETVLQILIQAAKLHKEYQATISPVEPHPHDSDSREQGIDKNPLDLQSADAITLVRHNQTLLCDFVMQQLQREQHSSHEILLQSLLFLLRCATELFCPPENVIDIILQSADSLNELIKSLYYQLKEGNMHFDMEQLHGVQRRWSLLQRLVIASSGSDDGVDFIRNRMNGQYKCLIPPSSWMHKISKFSNNPYPLTRFLGWMAVSRHAKQYIKDGLFLASDLSQLTSLLSIFSDELALIDKIADPKVKASDTDLSATEQHFENKFGPYGRSSDQESFRVLYPDLHKFFPNMREQFGSFGEIILEAVGLQLISLPCNAVPDILCWFSDLCMWTYSETGKSLRDTRNADRLKGYASVNAKAIVLYLLESIISEHMEAMVPEMPRIAQVLISLCRAFYCDVAFLNSVLSLLRPLISYFLGKVTDDRTQFTDELHSLDFESNFEELFDSIRCRKEGQDSPGDGTRQGSLMIFVLGALFPELSFKRKREILQSLFQWVDFTTTEPISSFYSYLCAFQKVLGSCRILLIQNLNRYGMSLPYKDSEPSDASSKFPCAFPESASCSSFTKLGTEVDTVDADDLLDQGLHYLSTDEIKEFSEGLDMLVSKLIPAIEFTWKLHYQLAMKLTYTSAKCILLARCLSSISGVGSRIRNGDGEILDQSISDDLLSNCWRSALEGLIGAIITGKRSHCWQAASTMFDYLFSLPRDISLDCVICSICHVIKYFFLHAPRLSWRLQTDKWLTFLFMRGVGKLEGNEDSLVDLFCAMLCHPEPELRSIALQHLGRIVGLESYDGLNKLSHEVRQNSVESDLVVSVPESIISAIVMNTWDKVAALAVSDPSMLLKPHAMALLSGYIPFAGRAQLQSFLVASNTIMRGTGKLSPSMEEGLVVRLSIGLLATACLYSPAEDIALVPESVWRNLERMGMARTGGLDDREKKLCEVLCKLETEAETAKKAIKDALSLGTASKHCDPSFRSTRESILQVLSSLTSTQSYFDFFARRADHDSEVLEEAEIEIDLLQKEKAMQEVSENRGEETPVPSYISYDMKDGNRLQKIKDDIQSLERSKLREEIAVRRQKRLLMRRARQKYLEEAASREVELLQEIDRERTNELERAIERQKQLELERAKTRELQFNLEMERERQTQRDLQRELEQAESGVRSSRREFTSNPNSRPRERYRERDNVRPGHEGTMRSSSRGRESATSQITSGTNATSPAPTVVLAGSRSFSGQLPTILQSRDRTEERSTGYDDNFEGSRDSGDTNSVGDPELASAFDGLGGGVGSVPRHGTRGSKSRQIAERRERGEGRREGKWERKHS